MDAQCLTKATHQLIQVKTSALDGQEVNNPNPTGSDLSFNSREDCGDHDIRESAENRESMRKNDQKRPKNGPSSASKYNKRRKAKRACGKCQTAHLTCGM